VRLFYFLDLLRDSGRRYLLKTCTSRHLMAMSKARIPLLLIFVISILSPFISTGLAKDNRDNGNHKKKSDKVKSHYNYKRRHRIVQWSPDKLKLKAEVGCSFSTDVQLKSNKSISKIYLRVTPKLRPFITVTPPYLKKIKKGRIYSVNIDVVIPPTTEIGLYKGAIHLRERSRSSHDDSNDKHKEYRNKDG